MANGWTPERQAKQAEDIRRYRPWEKATGPKTAAGKARASQNATRHGRLSRRESDLIDRIRAYIEATGAKKMRPINARGWKCPCCGTCLAPTPALLALFEGDEDE